MLSGLGHDKNPNNNTNNPYSAHARPNFNPSNQPLNPNNPNYNSINDPNYNSNAPNLANPYANANTYNQPLHSNINDKHGFNNTTDPYRNDQLNRNHEQGSLPPHTGYHQHGNHPHGTNTAGTAGGTTAGLSHTFDADKDRYMNRVGSNNTGTTGLGSGTGTGMTGLGTGTQYGTTGTTQPYGNTNTTQQPYGTTGTGTQQPYGTQQQGYGTQQQPYGTTGTGTVPGANRPMSVEDITRNVQAQIDAQAEQAVLKSRELNAQDHARLQQSISEATASLEEQARQLKQQIDDEKVIAAQHVKQTHDQKLRQTAQVQQMEEQKILEAAAQRKLELEQRAMKIQQEIDAIVRQKTEEMMRVKPAGDVGHILDLKNSGRVTETTLQGNNQYQPNVPIPNQPYNNNNNNNIQQPSNIPITQNTLQGQETHEKKGGFFHALKTAITGHHDDNNNTNQQPGVGNTGYHTNQYGTNQQPVLGNTGYNTNTNQYGTNQQPVVGNTGYNTNIKQQPMVGNRGYDQQSTWSSDADKHMPQQQQTR